MKTNANIPSSREVREYTREGYEVWTTLKNGSGINKKEAVIKGRECSRTGPAIARSIGMNYSEWVTRVQVIKWDKGHFIAWVNVKGDKIYEFVDEFNKTGRISHTVASIKRGMDSEKKLVVHKIEGKTKFEIAKMIGEDKVQHVDVKGKTAFVTMMTQTYAQTVIGNKQLNAEISPYMNKEIDPHKAMAKRFQRTKDVMSKQIESLIKRVKKLEQLVAEGRGYGKEKNTINTKSSQTNHTEQLVVGQSPQTGHAEDGVMDIGEQLDQGRMKDDEDIAPIESTVEPTNTEVPPETESDSSGEQDQPVRIEVEDSNDSWESVLYEESPTTILNAYIPITATINSSEGSTMGSNLPQSDEEKKERRWEWRRRRSNLQENVLFKFIQNRQGGGQR